MIGCSTLDTSTGAPQVQRARAADADLRAARLGRRHLRLDPARRRSGDVQGDLAVGDLRARPASTRSRSPPAAPAAPPRRRAPSSSPAGVTGSRLPRRHRLRRRRRPVLRVQAGRDRLRRRARRRLLLAQLRRRGLRRRRALRRSRRAAAPTCPAATTAASPATCGGARSACPSCTGGGRLPHRARRAASSRRSPPAARAGGPYTWKQGCFADVGGDDGDACAAPTGQPDDVALPVGPLRSLRRARPVQLAVHDLERLPADGRLRDLQRAADAPAKACLRRCDATLPLHGDPLLDCEAANQVGGLGFTVTPAEAADGALLRAAPLHDGRAVRPVGQLHAHGRRLVLPAQLTTV